MSIALPELVMSAGEMVHAIRKWGIKKISTSVTCWSRMPEHSQSFYGSTRKDSIQNWAKIGCHRDAPREKQTQNRSTIFA
jgi:hypothetical protein